MPNLKVDIVFKTEPGSIAEDSSGNPISSNGQTAKIVKAVYLQAIVTNTGNADSPVSEVLFSCQGTTTNGRLQPNSWNDCKGKSHTFKVKALKPGESNQLILSLDEGGFSKFDSVYMWKNPDTKVHYKLEAWVNPYSKFNESNHNDNYKEMYQDLY